MTLAVDVDISSYDRIGKRTTLAEATLADEGESGEFLFLESGDAGDTVAVAFLGSTGGQVQLKLSGGADKGAHLGVLTDGKIGPTGSDYSQEVQENEIGVTLADFVDGDAVECDLYKT
ncbi:hypothetical protein C4585_01550 [Candidatus Parcubacteria bacterium]|nr:MAG: hypothetical protein C4585_01550 [Candidatus Parcubacteria bacterium]